MPCNNLNRKASWTGAKGPKGCPEVFFCVRTCPSNPKGPLEGPFRFKVGIRARRAFPEGLLNFQNSSEPEGLFPKGPSGLTIVFRNPYVFQINFNALKESFSEPEGRFPKGPSGLKVVFKNQKILPE